MENYYTVKIADSNYTIVAPSDFLAAESAVKKMITNGSIVIPKDAIETIVPVIVNEKKLAVSVKTTVQVNAFKL